MMRQQPQTGGLVIDRTDKDHGPRFSGYLNKAYPLAAETIDLSERIANDSIGTRPAPFARPAAPPSVIEFVFGRPDALSDDEELRLGAVLEGLAWAARTAARIADEAGATSTLRAVTLLLTKMVQASPSEPEG